MDLRNGTLKFYEGTFVAYWKGILCGQSVNGEALLKRASDYYGSSNLAIFKVPLDGKKVNLEEALGQF